ncbi:MAG: hypothetical protein V3W20_10370, partial [Candidatus Neomarinimicrobiota bacterium]
ENKGSDEFQNIVFNVNTNLLSAKRFLINNKLELRIPIDYHKINDDTFLTVKKTIESDSTAFFKMSLLSVFNSPNGSYLLISKIISDKNVFEEVDSNYYELLVENIKTRNIDIGNVKINGINVIQYLITTNDTVIIKLILNVKDSYYQIDYIIPLEIYEKELKFIESSIGSIIEIKEAHK